MEIKRGYKPDFKPSYSLKNDELGQLILSFVMQRPGTSRSGKKVIFENQSIYDKIFKVNYVKTSDKKRFLLDIIKFKERYDEVEKKLKSDGYLSSTQLIMLKNGRQTIYAIMGLLYRLANNDVQLSDLNGNPKSVVNVPFEYGPILSSYHGDDIDKKLLTIVQGTVDILSEAYEKAYDNKSTTSISNFTKTDNKYYNDIIAYYIKQFKYNAGKDIMQSIDILKR